MLPPIQDAHGILAIDALEHRRWKLQSVVAPPEASRNELVRGLEQSPPAAVHCWIAFHIRSEQYTVSVLRKERRGRTGLAPDLVIPRRYVDEQVRETIQYFRERCQVVALIAQVTGDELSAGVARQHAVTCRQQVFVREHVLAILIEMLEVRRALLVRSER